MSGATTRVRVPLAAAALVLTLAACGGGGGSEAAAPAGPDPALRPYCDTIMRVQSEQTAPDAGTGGVAESAADSRRQVAEVVAVAPEQIAMEWRAVQQYTEQSVAALEATGGDAERIDRAQLQRLQQEAAPSADRIRTFTEQGCGITFQTPG